VAGIYLHIPFCKQACHYCNFHFSTTLKNYETTVKSICWEIENRTDYLPENSIDTIYFGGGTPSILENADLKQILEAIRKNYSVNASAEITLEANPDDITQEKLKVWKTAGINRLSIGVQSFFEDDLKWMNRAHNAEQAESALRWAKEAGFENITADLIYGLPHGHWNDNIQKMVSFGIPHISSYALMLEENTALHHFVKTKKTTLPLDENVVKDYTLLCDELLASGYEHYEISNFSRPDFKSKHNGSYWKGIPYLGIGPSAHSYDGKNRRWNVANNQLYAKNIAEGKIYWEDEVLTEEDRFNEYLMTGLRKAEGISLDYIESKFSETLVKHLIDSAAPLLTQRKLLLKDEVLIIPETEWFTADTIIAELFWVD
jgi:oxygen-independent coproporphyrinogen-3 oxidase